MRLILAAVAALTMVSAANAAEVFSTPRELVAAIYDDYNLGRTIADPSVYYSARLKGILDQAIENDVFASDAAMSGSEFTLDAVFNPFLPDVNALLFDVSIGEPSIIADRAVINAAITISTSRACSASPWCATRTAGMWTTSPRWATRTTGC